MEGMKNWVRYEVEIEDKDVGWVEVSPIDVFKDTMFLKLFDELITYNNGKLYINENHLE